jgi:lipid II:glycine glycyltransferase (peptidoglycan interpeptide bridge formation enzyme)
MQITEATSQSAWDHFLSKQQYRPFLQSWTMGEVYREVGQEPIRLQIRDGNDLVGICQAIVVPARRGRHLTVSYGPVLRDTGYPPSPRLRSASGIRDTGIEKELAKIAKENHCSFIRMSPFLPSDQPLDRGGKPSPLHLLAEHIWYISLVEHDPWQNSKFHIPNSQSISKENILTNMRKNHRNLIRRAEKEGVTIERSSDPVRDLPLFLELHEETRKRHGFTPYTNKFFETQVRLFSRQNACTLYLAKYNHEVTASSIHMHLFGETSYHHGASTQKYQKIPASYLLQWTAIQDALKRGDHVYNFWGIAPANIQKHPFAGVTTFKKGFGGKLLELQHCTDIPIRPQYYLTRAFEYIRKWQRNF